MKRVKTLNDYIRVSATRASLVAGVFGIIVTGGLIGCADRDSQVRTTRTSQNEMGTSRSAQNEVGSRYQSEDARASQRGFESDRYDADNTGLNARDRDNRGKTAGDQAMGGSENRILADIRREITANDNMSTNAKNVKIVIEDGTVTLRGPVNSQNEKQSIERTVTTKAPDLRVVNELEVRERS